MIKTLDSDMSNETRKDAGKKSEDWKGCIKNESQFGIYKTGWREIQIQVKKMDGVSDALHNEMKIR